MVSMAINCIRAHAHETYNAATHIAKAWVLDVRRDRSDEERHAEANKEGDGQHLLSVPSRCSLSTDFPDEGGHDTRCKLPNKEDG